jgi:hypothetical protein
MIQPTDAQIAQAREWISHEIALSAEEAWTVFLSEKSARDESLAAFIKQCQGFFDGPNLLRRLRISFDDGQFATQCLPDPISLEQPANLAADELLDHIRNVVRTVRSERAHSMIRRTGKTPFQERLRLSHKDIDILDLRYGVTRPQRLESGAIAALTGRSPQGVRSALSRAVKRIRNYYILD